MREFIKPHRHWSQGSASLSATRSMLGVAEDFRPPLFWSAAREVLTSLDGRDSEDAEGGWEGEKIAGEVEMEIGSCQEGNTLRP